MDRAICEGNRVVNSRAKKLNKIIHRQKVRSISKGVDNETPYSLTHPQNKRSKEFKIEGKLSRNGLLKSLLKKDALKSRNKIACS